MKPKALRVIFSLSRGGLLAGQHEAAQDLLAVGRFDAAGETTQVLAQMAEEAFRQVGGAQTMPNGLAREKMDRDGRGMGSRAFRSPRRLPGFVLKRNRKEETRRTELLPRPQIGRAHV